MTGLDYYNARYYDPVSGLFLSADNVQGNAQGADPYSYVAGNPETLTDPTGHKVYCPPSDTKDCYPDGTQRHKPDPTGGCGTGEHRNSGACIYDGGACGGSNADYFQPGAGGCVYSSGECEGRTVAGCEQFKRQRDEDAIKHYREMQHQAADAIPYDVLSIIMYALTGWGDLESGSLVAAISDFAFAFTYLLTLISNAVVAAGKGGAPVASFLNQLTGTAQTIVSFVTFMKGYVSFLWGFSNLLQPVFGLAKKLVFGLIRGGLMSMTNALLNVIGGNTYQSPESNSDLDSMSFGQIQQECRNDGIATC